jgi:hypothetical protein
MELVSERGAAKILAQIGLGRRQACGALHAGSLVCRRARRESPSTKKRGSGR